LEQPKNLDPFLFTRDIIARKIELTQAAQNTFGRAKFGNNTEGDEREQLISASTSPPRTLYSDRRQQGSAARIGDTTGPLATSTARKTNMPRCVIQ
jgi:hypothetical protein